MKIIKKNSIPLFSPFQAQSYHNMHSCEQ